MFWPFKKKVITESVEEVKPPDTKNLPQSLNHLLSDEDRVAGYVASGQEIVDLSNKPRLPNDGFASDGELMKPWNQAHAGTKKGLSDLMKGGRR
jgi:hypothetical protein